MEEETTKTKDEEMVEIINKATEQYNAATEKLEAAHAKHKEMVAINEISGVTISEEKPKPKEETDKEYTNRVHKELGMD